MMLLDRFQAGDIRALARLISLIEDGDPAAQEIMMMLARMPRSTHVTGITGPPGSGKSTLIGALVSHWRAEQQRVAVLAVDPSSVRTGGAALGDRVRMMRHHADPEVFIRSMAARGQLGGLAAATADAVLALAAFGFDEVVIETVGVGQSEIDVRAIVDVVVVVQVAGLGDEVQLLKAGLLEVADIIAVTKADLPGAAALAKQIQAIVASPDRGIVPVLPVSAATGSGTEALASAIRSCQSARTPGQMAEDWLMEAVLAEVRRRLRAKTELAEVAAELAAGTISREEAIERLVSGWWCES